MVLVERRPEVSQANVERVIGVLATDEALRSRFTTSPRVVLLEMIEKGMELTECEVYSLVSLDPRELTRFAQAVGPRLQRTDLRGGGK
jgi:hypothetical protein